MTNEYGEKDVAFQKEIIDALVLRHTINLNREVGTAYLQAEWEDKINPCVTVTRDAIRTATGRDKMRDKVIEQYEVALRRPGFDVARLDEDTLKICVSPIRSPKNEFNSVTELRRKNEDEIEAAKEADPDCDLAAPPLY